MYCENCGKKNEDNIQFCIYCGNNLEKGTILSDETPKKNKTRASRSIKVFLAIVGLIILAIGLIMFFSDSDTETSPRQITTEINNIKTVVNILCDESGGSGIMLSEDGIILTNHHVISGEENCLVTIPDSTSGEPVEIYQATPVVFPEISERYDIAMLEINDVYTDEDGESWGLYPNKFTYFQTPEGCTNDPWKLGEPIKIYGYPSTSNNFNLTVTEGIISNFDSGYILTSAKVDSGNSGGLALNQEGCMVGIPSAVLTGDHQNLGVIISWDIIGEFIDELDVLAESSDIESFASQQKQLKNPTPLPTKKIFVENPSGVTDKPLIASPASPGVKDPYRSDEHINSVKAEALGGGKVRVTWNKLNREVLYYIVDYGTSSGSYNFSTPAGNSDSIEIGALNPGRMYFRVKGGWHEPNSIWKYAYSNESSTMVK